MKNEPREMTSEEFLNLEDEFMKYLTENLQLYCCGDNAKENLYDCLDDENIKIECADGYDSVQIQEYCHGDN